MRLEKVAAVVDRVTFEVARAIGVVALLGFIIHISLDVSTRAIAGSGWSSTLDFITSWYMPILVYTGFVVAQHTREHMEVDLLTARLSAGAQRALHPLILVAMVAFVSLLFWYGLEGALEDMEERKSGLISGLPLWPVRFIIPVGAILLILQILASGILEKAKADHE